MVRDNVALVAGPYLRHGLRRCHQSSLLGAFHPLVGSAAAPWSFRSALTAQLAFGDAKCTRYAAQTIILSCAFLHEYDTRFRVLQTLYQALTQTWSNYSQTRFG